MLESDAARGDGVNTPRGGNSQVTIIAITQYWHTRLVINIYIPCRFSVA